MLGITWKSYAYCGVLLASDLFYWTVVIAGNRFIYGYSMLNSFVIYFIKSGKTYSSYYLRTNITADDNYFVKMYKYIFAFFRRANYFKWWIVFACTVMYAWSFMVFVV